MHLWVPPRARHFSAVGTPQTRQCQAVIRPRWVCPDWPRAGTFLYFNSSRTECCIIWSSLRIIWLVRHSKKRWKKCVRDMAHIWHTMPTILLKISRRIEESFKSLFPQSGEKGSKKIKNSSCLTYALALRVIKDFSWAGVNVHMCVCVL